jgi:RIO-like serine/threonine protein kinase
VAIVVARRGPMFGAAWLVMELAEGVRLDRADPLEHVDAIVTLFGQLARAGLVHGDTKASNFVVTPRGLVLLDLDAMRSPRSRTMRRRGQRQDVERFLANWPARSPLGEAFERARLG